MYLFQKLLDDFEKESIPVLTMSTLTEEGVMEVRAEVMLSVGVVVIVFLSR